MPKLLLRRFQYLDAPLVRQFLAQVPGGTAIPLRKTIESKGQSSLGAGAGYGPLSAKAARDKSNTESTDYEVERSGPADFNQLHALALEQGLIQPLNALDEAIWKQLEVGELVEVRARLARPKIQNMLEAAVQFQALAGVMKEMGQQFTPDQERTLALIDVLGPLLSNATPTLLAAVAGSPRFRFVLTLDPEHLIDDVESIEGEATVFGTVERITSRGEFVTVADLVKNLEAFLPNRAARRRRKASTSAADDDFIDEQELRIGHPAGLLTPVAIYR